MHDRIRGRGRNTYPALLPQVPRAVHRAVVQEPGLVPGLPPQNRRKSEQLVSAEALAKAHPQTLGSVFPILTKLFVGK